MAKKIKTKNNLKPNVSLNYSKIILLLALVFLINFILFLLTLSPTVTFEDSGELITAAYNLGVPHQPGYPLFTILAKLFSFIPIGNIAFRVNMMSAFFSSLAAVLITYVLILIFSRNCRFTEQILIKNTFFNYFVLLLAAFGGLLFAFSFENWEQSLITEVYGLNSFFVAATILILVQWQQSEISQQKVRLFMLLALLLGLGSCNHSTFFMFFPISIVFIFICDKKFLFKFKNIALGLIMLVIGFAPLLYLPVASAADPIIDWGNPENWTNFWRTISRHQYQLENVQNMDKFSAQFNFFVTELIPMQWIWPVLFFPVLGLVFIFRQNKPLFWLFVLLILFTMPITTWLTNFDVNTGNKFIDEEHKNLVSVFYIPAYMVIALLAAMGAAFVIHITAKAKTKLIMVLAVAFLLLPIINLFVNYQKADMSKFRYAEYYCDNLFDNLPKNALLMGNYDVFVFPLFYYQFVEGKRTDIISLDQQLLRRTWYIKSLQKHFPQLMKLVEKEVQEFLLAVAPFEAGKPYDGNFIQAKYEQMIKAIVDAKINNGDAVFTTYLPERAYMGNYGIEPQIFAYKIISATDTLQNLNDAKIDITKFINKPAYIDRTFDYVRNFYREQLLQRAGLAERAGKKGMAKILLKQALPMAKEHRLLYLQIQEKLKSLN